MYQKYGKRLLDIIASAITLVILSPLLLWLAWKIKENLGSPVIFSQIRPGKNNKLFRLYKFRSMTDSKDKDGNLLPDNERMTDFGRKLRSTSLDELPELWNILKGDMSIVGPRPQLVRDMVFFTEKEMHRQDVTPGLTGLAQISGRNNIDWKERFSYDLNYIENISIKEDLRIIWRTIFKVGNQEDIATEGMETSEDYGDWLLRKKIISHEEYDSNQIEAQKLLASYKGKNTEWKYYNHALLYNGAPHDDVDTDFIYSGKIWKAKWEGMPCLVRWTSNWDCGNPTQWWYCIADKPLDISTLKAKRRYEHNKAKRNFTVEKFDPNEYIEEMLNVMKESYNKYPSKYRPKLPSIEKMRNSAKEKNGAIFYGVFSRDGKLVGYNLCKDFGRYLLYLQHKVIPRYEKMGVNIALVDGVMGDYKEKLGNGFYIVDGERNISHETDFQKFLEKYAGFRKAYCDLHIEYNPYVRNIVKVVYPFRKVFFTFDEIKIVHNINSVLKMESIVRSEL